MRKLLLISFLLINYSIANAQAPDSANKKTGSSEQADPDKAFTKIEVEPEIDQGVWAKFLKKHINYDIAVFNDAPRGVYNVKVQFTVFTDGHVGNVVALTKFGYGMEEEVVKALKKSPKWTPATQNGKLVNVTRIQTVRFAVEVL